MHLFIRRCLLAAIVLFSQAGITADRVSLAPQIIEGRLDNGFSYTLAPMREAGQRIDIRLSVDAGSLDQQENEQGVAHMLEHMLYRGSQQFPQGIGNMLQQHGWQRGVNFNAMTNYERTLFMMSPPDGSHGLPLAIHGLSQMMGAATISPQDLQTERQIIHDEWRDKLGVAERMNQQRLAAIRAGSRYPSRPPIGNEQAILNTDAGTIKQFYQRWYHPSVMRLLISGDFDTRQAQQLIAEYFSALPDTAVVRRDYYEPELCQQLRIVRLQDSESGTSQVSFVTRFNETASGLQQRLISQMALSVLSRQFQQMPVSGLASDSHIIVRKSDIGRKTRALGLFLDVMPGQHTQGLTSLLRERERVLRYGADSRYIADERHEIHQTALEMVSAPEKRDFSGWVRTIASRWEQRRYQTDRQQLGQEVLRIESRITDQQINQQIRQWLMAGDQLIQFGIPGNSKAVLPDIRQAEQQIKQIADLPLQPFSPVNAPVLPELQPVRSTGSLSNMKDYPQQQVREWTLSNGDRLVWLRSDLAKDRIWLSATSQGGFMMDGSDPWWSQLASQLVNQSGPRGWQGKSFDGWKKHNGVSLIISQQADMLHIDSTGSRQSLENLLAINHEIQVNPGIDPQVRAESIMRMLRQQAAAPQATGGNAEQQIHQLRYSKTGGEKPDARQLNSIDNRQLLAQWQHTTATPVTWYLVADMEQQPILTLAARYLATIPRTLNGEVQPQLADGGYRQQISTINREPQANVKVWSFTPRDWSPAAAVQVSIARNLAYQALKTSLRDNALGVYRLQFNSELNDRSGRIETGLSFTADPRRAEELWQHAQLVLSELAGTITRQQIEQQRSQFIRAEQSRSDDIDSLKRRLILSYRHYNDPRYLSQTAGLAEAIQPEAVRTMAGLLLNPQNLKVYMAMPVQ
ncbi:MULTISPECIES: pitrilysin family protein [unclassified Tatumella]|uniref:M16 family metallopeptidase n=1 Tax=unclassified Tatumella TaxID=2649542 RepID=UPI001BAF1747|nr:MULTISPECIES: pitrilysin family protein [unclassified Tatumella]MBS0878370.1 insulinase family protein [Tatumella sp. JGM82]MBS0891166.1 insulinase family protein [Tatumella sp. JGM94]MBS0902723.1 insulinase family protein [Tatumella sp. JGM100]